MNDFIVNKIKDKLLKNLIFNHIIVFQNTDLPKKYKNFSYLSM